MSTEGQVTGAEEVRFKLEHLYKGIADPAISSDLKQAAEQAKSLHANFHGKLSARLGDALLELCEIYKLTSKIFVFLTLNQACDAGNEKIQQALSRAREQWAVAAANYMTFFEQEVGRELSEQDYQRQIKEHPVVRHHQPYLDQIRKRARHLLSAEVERALTLRSPFGAAEWKEYVDECEVHLKFRVRHALAPKKSIALTELLNLMLHHADSDLRFAAMQALNRGLKKNLAPVITRALNTVVGEKGLDDAERGYPHVMASRNLDNQVSDGMVEALHEAVKTEGTHQAKRYYRLLARRLGKNLLRWSDRTARLKGPGSEHISWEKAVAMVESSWRRFSPTLADFVPQMVARGWVDAPVYKGKHSGAFNYSVVLPEPHGNQTFTLMNYLGTERDAMTLAHEFGHAVHGLLAGERQGPLMANAPLAYAETASIFGEMLVFEHLVSEAQTTEREFSLLMEKTSDVINSVVRQISFSSFEQKVHTLRTKGRLTTKEYCRTWKEVTREFYGPEGEVFTYKDADYLWSYVGHFMSPFYVYAYAFGELLTQSLFALRESLGSRFEPLYLELLRAGGSKDAEALLKPFGLNPSDPDFWRRGILGSLGKWLDRAEALQSKL